MNIELKTFQFELKAVDDAQGIIEGYGSVFNNVDHGKDRVMPGAFKRTIQNAKQRSQKSGKPVLFKMLWQHDPEKPIGVWTDAKEDDHGLQIKGQINLQTQLGREAYELIKQGAVDELSIGYDTIDSDYDKSIRNLKELRLWEISPVTFAMNDQALVTGVKGKKPTAPPAGKDFNDRYRQNQISDWLYSDWSSLIYALKQSIQDAFASGDEPQADLIDIILNDSPEGPGFISALKNYVQEGIDLDYSNYLQEQNDDDDYGYMSSSHEPETKEGRMLSSVNHATMTKAVQGIMGHCKDMSTLLQQATKPKSDSLTALRTKAAPQDDSEVSTHLNELLASIELTQLTRNLKKQ